MKNYTEKETAVFKAERNRKSNFNKKRLKSFWKIDFNTNKVTNSFTYQKAIFNQSTKSLTFVNA